MPRKQAKKSSAADESVRGVEDPSTSRPRTKNKGGGGKRSGKRSVKGAPNAGTDPPTNDGQRKGQRGVPGSKNPERRCHAMSRGSGEQCKRAAIKGGTVCTTHGGAAPQVRKSARERLLELVEPAIAELSKLLNRKDVDDTVRLRAIQLLLDRTGFGPGQYVTLQTSKWDQAFEDGEFELDRSAPPDLKRTSTPPTAPPQDDDDVVDAEWYSDDDAPAGTGGGGGPTEPAAERYGPGLETREQYLLRMLDEDR